MPFNLFVTETHSDWNAQTRNDIAARVLTALEDNPFAAFTEMDVNYSTSFQPYDRAKALQELINNDEVGVTVQTSSPFYLNGGVSRHPLQNGCRIGGDPRYLSNPEELDEVKSYLNEWREVLPKFSWGGISADDRENVFFFEELNLEPLPECFGTFLGWHHLIGPRGYEPFFTLDDLRRTPAEGVDVHPDGAVAITAYADPLAFHEPQSTRRIIEITNYLNERRKD